VLTTPQASPVGTEVVHETSSSSPVIPPSASMDEAAAAAAAGGGHMQEQQAMAEEVARCKEVTRLLISYNCIYPFIYIYMKGCIYIYIYIYEGLARII